jgi:hypothetical protein
LRGEAAGQSQNRISERDRSPEVQRVAAALETPGCKHWLGQLPAGIGQITRIRSAFAHDLGIVLAHVWAQTRVLHDFLSDEQAEKLIFGPK